MGSAELPSRKPSNRVARPIVGASGTHPKGRVAQNLLMEIRAGASLSNHPCVSNADLAGQRQDLGKISAESALTHGAGGAGENPAGAADVSALRGT
jgi:hypothetical protein